MDSAAKALTGSSPNGSPEEKTSLLAAAAGSVPTSYTAVSDGDTKAAEDVESPSASDLTDDSYPPASVAFVDPFSVETKEPELAASSNEEATKTSKPVVRQQSGRTRQRHHLGRNPEDMPNSKFDTFEALNGITNMSIVKTSQMYKHALKTHQSGEGHSAHHNRLERWVVNGVIGFTCGLSSFLLKMVVQFLSGVREHMITAESSNIGLGFVWWAWFTVILLSGALVLISAAIIIYIEPNAAGSGIPETCAFLNGVILPKTFSGSVVLAKFASCGLAVGSGLPVGPEGPMIHMGSIIGSLISQGQALPVFFADKLKMFRNVSDRRDFMAAGVAGGVAAAFSAPIGGLLFVAEEVASHWDINLGMQVFFCSVVSCTTVEILTSSFEGFQYIAPLGMIQEHSAILFDVNKVIPVNIAMFVPVCVVGAIGGLLGALFNIICLQAATFRAKHIKPYPVRFLLEPVGIVVVYVTAMMCLPAVFACVRDDCGGDASKPGCERVGLSEVDEGMTRYGCKPGFYNPSASLYIPSGESIVRALFSRGFHYQYDYLSVLSLLVVYLPVSAYANGISCATGIVIPCLMNGALIGRFFGLLMTDLLGVHDSPEMLWVDPGAFALIGAAGFFAGVARITMALTVIMTEISNDTHFILPIMTAIMVGKWTADATGVHPIYHALMAKKSFPYLQVVPHVHEPLECFTAGQVAVKKVACVPLEMTVSQLARLLLEFKHNAFPCTVPGPSGDSQDGQFVGIVLREHLVALTKTPSLWNGTKKAQELKNRMDEIFDQVDENGDGQLDLDEVVHAARRGHVCGMDEHQVVELFRELDTKNCGTLNRADVSMDTKQLQAFELKAFDSPEELSSAHLDAELQGLGSASTSAHFKVDLKPYVDCSAFSVPETFSLAHTYSLFRSMGLRHLVVVDAFNSVAGVITRHNLMDANLNECCTPANMKSPDELLDHVISQTD